ncbi:MAG TPA: hypothetical protein VGD74_05300, partial [Vulgatibacter sp.]
MSSRFDDDLLTAESILLRLGETQLVAEGSGTPRQKTAELHLRGAVEAESARRFGYPLAGDVLLEGDVRQRGLRTEVDLHASRPGEGRVRIAGTLEDDSKRVDMRLHLDRVNPGAFIASAPRGTLSGVAEVRGPLAPMKLHASLHLEAGALGGAELGPASASGQIVRPSGGDPRVELDRAEVLLPGARLEGRGTFARDEIDARLRVDLANLGKLSRWLASSFDVFVPQVDATGILVVDADGAPRDLRFHVVADLDEVRAPGVDATRVRLEASGAAGEDLWPSGEAIVRIAELRAGEVELDAIHLRVDRDPAGAFSLSLRTARSDGRRAGASICATGIARPGFLRVGLGRLAFRQGGIDLEAKGDAVATEGRLTGNVEVAGGEVGIVRATYDGPLAPLRAKASAPVSLVILAAPLDLGGLARITGRPLPAGRLRGRLAAGGTIGSPDIEVDARGTGIWFAEVPRLKPVDVRAIARHRAAVGTWPSGELELALDGWIGDVRVFELAAGVPLDLGAVRSAPRAEIDRVLGSARSRISAQLRGVDLEALGEVLGRAGLHGAVTAGMDLRGPLRDPRGSVSVEILGGPLGPVREVHAAASALLGDDSVRLSATLVAVRDDGAQAAIELAVGASMAQLLSRQVAESTPIAGSIELTSIDLAQLTNDRTDEEGRLRGVLEGGASFAGTVGDPCGGGVFRVEGLGARGAELGDAELSLAMDASLLQARLHAIDVTGGTLAAGIEIRENLARLLDGGARALAIARTSFRLEAKGLSLAPLGKALGVGYLGGTVDASLQARAPLRELEPTGAVTVRDGSIELPGGAIYDRISVRIVFQDDAIDIPVIDVHERKGGDFFASGRIGGDATRPVPSILASIVPALGLADGVGPVPFTLDLRADGLPVSAAGGPLAKISLRDRIEGTIGPGAGLQATFVIASAHVELPSRPPRNLQQVGPLPDVVFLPSSAG